MYPQSKILIMPTPLPYDPYLAHLEIEFYFLNYFYSTLIKRVNQKLRGPFLFSCILLRPSFLIKAYPLVVYGLIYHAMQWWSLTMVCVLCGLNPSRPFIKIWIHALQDISNTQTCQRIWGFVVFTSAVIQKG